jgi:hypothetical protein
MNKLVQNKNHMMCITASKSNCLFSAPVYKTFYSIYIAHCEYNDTSLIKRFLLNFTRKLFKKTHTHKRTPV